MASEDPPRFSATRFVVDSVYRDQVGIPHLRGVLAKTWRGMARETRETFRAVGHMIAVADGRRLTDAERLEVRHQLQDLAKAVPMLAVFLLPGGMILLPLLLKILPFDLRLSGFKEDEVELPAEDETPSTE